MPDYLFHPNEVLDEIVFTKKIMTPPIKMYRNCEILAYAPNKVLAKFKFIIRSRKAANKPFFSRNIH